MLVSNFGKVFSFGVNIELKPTKQYNQYQMFKKKINYNKKWIKVATQRIISYKSNVLKTGESLTSVRDKINL